MSTPYAIVFMLFSALTLLIAVTSGDYLIQASAAWATLAFGLVALAYSGVGPRLLLKRAAGQRPPTVWLFYGPYLLLNELSLALFRAFERHPPYVEVIPISSWAVS